MDKKKIQRLANKIKKMHLDPENGDKMSPQERQMIKDFWRYHIVPVMSESRRLAKKYAADEDVVWLGALLHDISLTDSRHNHHILSAQKAHAILIKAGFDKNTASKVRNIALRHRVREHKPISLEEKIVVTADAMSHFSPSFYLGIATVASEDYAEIMARNFSKLERDAKRKIFFPDERQVVQQKLKDFKRWFRF